MQPETVLSGQPRRMSIESNDGVGIKDNVERAS